jgi:hypothetical protein
MKFIAAMLATLSMLVSASAQADPTKTREDVRMVAMPPRLPAAAGGLSAEFNSLIPMVRDNLDGGIVGWSVCPALFNAEIIRHDKDSLRKFRRARRQHCTTWP